MFTTSALIPYDEIADSAWSRLSHAADDPTHRMRQMAVATVMPNGRPSNRMLVLRGVDRSTGLIWFHTDRRSPKMHHLKHQPRVSALAYDAHERVQIRMDGEATVHEHDALADHHWEQVSMVVRHAYGSAHAPGEPMPLSQTERESMSQAPHSRSAERGRQNFAVLQIRVEAIDWLQVSAIAQIRAIMRAETGWTVEPFAP